MDSMLELVQVHHCDAITYSQAETMRCAICVPHAAHGNQTLLDSCGGKLPTGSEALKMLLGRCEAGKYGHRALWLVAYVKSESITLGGNISGSKVVVKRVVVIFLPDAW